MYLPCYNIVCIQLDACRSRLYAMAGKDPDNGHSPSYHRVEEALPTALPATCKQCVRHISFYLTNSTHHNPEQWPITSFLFQDVSKTTMENILN